MSANPPKEINIKLILVGDSNVGKTTLLNSYIDNNCSEDVAPTVGLEKKVKTIDINGLKTKLQIWDTAGQEKFNSLTQQYFRNADGILMIFDLTNTDTFSHIKKLYEKSNDISHKSKKILIGNKSDMKDKIKVKKNDIDAFTKKKIKYIEASAKDNINVEEAFQLLINLIVGKSTNEELIADFGISDSPMSLSGSTFINTGGDDKKKCCI